MGRRLEKQATRSVSHRIRSFGAKHLLLPQALPQAQPRKVTRQPALQHYSGMAPGWSLPLHAPQRVLAGLTRWVLGAAEAPLVKVDAAVAEEALAGLYDDLYTESGEAGATLLRSQLAEVRTWQPLGRYCYLPAARLLAAALQDEDVPCGAGQQ